LFRKANAILFADDPTHMFKALREAVDADDLVDVFLIQLPDKAICIVSFTCRGSFPKPVGEPLRERASQYVVSQAAVFAETI